MNIQIKRSRTGALMSPVLLYQIPDAPRLHILDAIRRIETGPVTRMEFDIPQHGYFIVERVPD